jgi:hypothetical protein
VVVALVPAASLVRNWKACDLSRATWVREFARQKLEDADPDGVLITQGDQDMFPIWYVHDVLGVRPDVTPIDRAIAGGLWRDYDRDPSLWYLHHLRRQGIDAPVEVPPTRAGRARLGSDGYLIGLLTRQFRDRPVCMTFAGTKAFKKKDGRRFLRWTAERYHMLPQGIVLRLHPRRERVNLAALLRRNERLWGAIALPDLTEIRTDQDLDPDYVVNHYACMLVNFGALHERAGDRERAEALYRRAANFAPHYQPAAEALTSLRRDPRAPRPVASGDR